jgi:hypothetical protein
LIMDAFIDMNHFGTRHRIKSAHDKPSKRNPNQPRYKLQMH